MVAYRGAVFGHCHYAATKGAILSFTRTIARTGAPYHITANAIRASLKTELLFQTHGDEGWRSSPRPFRSGWQAARCGGWRRLFSRARGAITITGACIDVNGGMYFH